MQLSHDHYKLLLQLRRNPLASYNELGRQLGLAPNTVRAWCQQLKEIGALRQDRTIDDPILGERLISDVVGHPSPSELGLRRVYVAIDDLNGPDAYRKVSLALDAHPYTYFRVMTMGPHLGMLSMFDIPPDGLAHLESFIYSLKKMGLFSSWELLNVDKMSSSEDHLDNWDNQRQQWSTIVLDEDVDKRGKGDPSIEGLLTKYLAEGIQSASDYGGEDATSDDKKSNSFDEMDFRLLRELTINAKLRIQDISKHYSRDSTTLSRRLGRIKKQLVSGFTLMYDRTLFDLGSAFLLSGSADSDTLQALHRIVENNDVPCMTSLASNGNNRFFWLQYCPVGMANDLVHLLLKHTRNLQQHPVHTKESARYFFYGENRDFEQGKWRDDKQYMVDEPLHSLK